MKTSITTTVILKAIDLELRALLQKDLKQFKIAQHTNKQVPVKKAA